MNRTLTPEGLRERAVAFFEHEAETNTAAKLTDDDWALIVVKAYATGWVEGGGIVDPLTMLEAEEGA